MPTPIDRGTGLRIDADFVVTGGHAAAMCLEPGVEPRTLAGSEVRERLNRAGARLDADAVLT